MLSSLEPALPLRLAEVYHLSTGKIGLVFIAGAIPAFVCMSTFTLAFKVRAADCHISYATGRVPDRYQGRRVHGVCLPPPRHSMGGGAPGGVTSSTVHCFICRLQ